MVSRTLLKVGELLKPKKWIYLLTGLMYPTKRVQPGIHPHSHETPAGSVADIDFSRIGIRLKRVFLTEKLMVSTIEVDDGHENDNRFAFYINDGEEDDTLAQRFADATMLSLDVAYDVAAEETFTAIRISESCIKRGCIIRIKDIVGDAGIGSHTYSRVVRALGVPSDVLDYVWRIVPVILENQSLMDAAGFYRESIMQAWVADDDVFEIMQNNSDLPLSQAERARVETAYQNAFKAVEAVIGEPSKDEAKLRLKLTDAGINPDEIFGYDLYGMKPGKETFLKKLKDMHQTRDKKAAHGRTNIPRTIGYRELKDKQAFACYLIQANIDFILQSRDIPSSSAQTSSA
jgi:hypothetical protein